MKRKRPSFASTTTTTTAATITTTGETRNTSNKCNVYVGAGKRRYSPQLSHLLHVLLNTSDYRSMDGAIIYSPPSGNTITRLLQTRGTLEEITQNSQCVDECISQLTDASLAQLFSVLLEEEILCGSSMRSMRVCTDTEEGASHGDNHDHAQVPNGNYNHSGKRKTNVRPILMFVERVLWKRYYRASKASRIVPTVDAIDEWIERGHTIQQLNNRFETKNFCNPPGRDGDSGEDWVTCVAFMMAYSALYERIQSDNFTDRASLDKSQIKEHSSSDTVDSLITAGSDIIITDALRILLMLKCIAHNMATLKACTTTRKTNATHISTQQQSNVIDHCHDDNYIENNLHNNTVESILDKCFKKQLSKIDSLVRSIHDARLQKQYKLSVTSRARQKSSGGKLPIDILLEEMRNDSSFMQDCDLSGEDEVQLSMTQSQISMTQSQDGLSQFNNETDDEASNLAQGDNAKKQALETLAGQMRSNLLQLTRSATASEVKTLSDSIADLIQKAGAELGVDGVVTIGSILITEQSDDDNDPPPFLRSDALLSNLCKSCITQDTSAVRASAFIYTFILPHVDELKRSKSRPPSRLMMSTISALVRDRHVECVESLFVPILCRTRPPSQPQCELVCRIIKSIAIPKESISLFVSKILLDSIDDRTGDPLRTMPWSDHSIPILTSCLQKKPMLNDGTIVLLTQQIDQHSKDATFAKSVKFSTLFHALVTKFGPQLETSGSLDMLNRSSVRLKTFLGKSILSSLKKI